VKTVAVLGGLVATVCLTLVAVATDPPRWLLVVVALVVGVGLAGAGHWVMVDADALVEIPTGQRRWMAHLVAVAVVAHIACLVVFTLVEGLRWQIAAALACLVVLEWLVAVVWNWTLAHVRPRPHAEVVPFVPDVEPDPAPEQSLEATFHRALALEGLQYVQVIRATELPYGASFTCRTPSALAAAAGGKPAKVAPLTSDDADRIGNALMEETGIPIQRGWVQVTDEPYPNVVTVTVTTQDVLAMAHPYPLEEEPLPPGAPATIGFRIDGAPIELNVHQHGIVVGKTRSGKTSLVNVVLAELMRMPGRKQLCGAEKVYDLAGQWLDPHLGTDNPLPLDWVREGQDDTLALLVEGMREARWRQNLPHADRVGLDPLWIVVEEAPRVLKDRTRKAWFEGRWYVATELVAHMMRSTASSGVFLILLAQEYDNAMFGDDAASIKANTGYTILMRSKDGDERSRAFGAGGAKLPNLYNAGEFYIEDGSAPYRGKARYIQEVDARMRRLHDGATLTDVTVSRSRLVSALTGGRTAPPTELYASRPTRMTSSYREYLRGIGRGDTPEPEPLEASVERELDAVFAQLETGGAATPETRVELSDVPPAKRTLLDRIVEVVTEQGPIARREVLSALQAGGAVTESSMDNALSKLVSRGQLARTQEGVYSLP
jgi:hypothetical protein